MNAHCDSPREATAIGVPILCGTLVQLRPALPETHRSASYNFAGRWECGPSSRVANEAFPHNPVLTLNIAADNYPQDLCLDWFSSLRYSPIGEHFSMRMSQRAYRKGLQCSRVREKYSVVDSAIFRPHRSARDVADQPTHRCRTLPAPWRNCPTNCYVML